MEGRVLNGLANPTTVGQSVDRDDMVEGLGRSSKEEDDDLEEFGSRRAWLKISRLGRRRTFQRHAAKITALRNREPIFVGLEFVDDPSLAFAMIDGLEYVESIHLLDSRSRGAPKQRSEFAGTGTRPTPSKDCGGHRQVTGSFAPRTRSLGIAFKSETAGPWSTFPKGLKRDPWHGQSQLRSAPFHRTTHPR